MVSAMVWAALDEHDRVWDSDEDQTELLRRLTDHYGVDLALSLQLVKVSHLALDDHDHA